MDSSEEQITGEQNIRGWGSKNNRKRKINVLWEKNQRSQKAICRSSSPHPLALSSHQRHQGGPNEVKTASTLFNLAYRLWSSSSGKKKETDTLVCLFSQLYQFKFCISPCWRPDESTDNSPRINPMTQPQVYSLIVSSLPSRTIFPGLPLDLYGPDGLTKPFANLK